MNHICEVAIVLIEEDSVAKLVDTIKLLAWTKVVVVSKTVDDSEVLDEFITGHKFFIPVKQVPS